MNEQAPSAPPRIKVCGVTRVEDACFAVEAGVDLLGLNFHSPSPRSVDVERGRELVAAVADRHGPRAVTWVGVFVDRSAAEMLDIAERVGLDLLQCHGDETPEAVAPIAGRTLKALRVTERLDPALLDDWLDLGLWGLLVDSRHPTLYGGTGEGWDFATLRSARVGATASPSSPPRLLIAGGLGPDNVAEAAAAARPWGVDLASGVESSPGVKDPALVRRLVVALRRRFDASRSAVASFPHEEIHHGESPATARR